MASIFKGDPTRTTILRKKFVSQFKIRFKIIRALSNASIVTNDCFGLNKPKIQAQFLEPASNQGIRTQAIPENQFMFDTNGEKVSKYTEWLKSTEATTVFQQTRQLRTLTTPLALWANTYIDIAYQRGILWAINNIKKDPKLLKTLGLSSNELYNINVIEAFNLPIHTNAVGMLHSRVLTDLEGITATMNSQIIRILTEGIESGASTKAIAKLISDRVDKIGIHRATLLARTEIVRAHHIASIQTYRNYGIYKIKIEAEWSTAGDSRVCEICSPLNGKIYTLDEIMYKIPVHPQCRCAALPYVQ